ncbi:MAG: hypothetical protein R2734_13820 [Nocardioides sp.]
MTEQTPDPGQNPYGQNPYGQAPAGQPSPDSQPPPYGAPGYSSSAYYASSAQASPAYGTGYASPARSDKRPGTVLAACLVAIVSSVLTAILFGFGLVAVFVAKSDFLASVEDSPEMDTAGISGDSLYSIVVAVLVIGLVWSLAGILLGALALRRSQVARIMLVVSSVVVAMFSLLAIMSGFSALWLIASIATIVLLFVGGANEWYSRRDSQPAVPGLTAY